MQATTTIPAELAKFEAMAAEWWDPNGKFKPLHMLNPCRLDYICQQIAGEFDRDLSQELPFKGIRLLDIGCGGGLLSEPMARLGATVVGADAAERNIPVARVHAEQSGLTIDYRHTTAEAMASAHEKFDVVLNMEVIEHVASPPPIFGGMSPTFARRWFAYLLNDQPQSEKFCHGDCRCRICHAVAAKRNA